MNIFTRKPSWKQLAAQYLEVSVLAAQEHVVLHDYALESDDRADNYAAFARQLQDDIDAATAHLLEMRQERLDLLEMLQNAATERDELQEQLRGHLEEILSLQGVISTINAERGALETENEQLRTRLAQLDPPRKRQSKGKAAQAGSEVPHD